MSQHRRDKFRYIERRPRIVSKPELLGEDEFFE